MERRRVLALFYLFSIILILLFALIYSINVGGVSIELKEILEIINHKVFGKEIDIRGSKIFIVWNIRLPRILVASLVGGSLSLAGVGLQAVFKNPMAEPFVTGTSAGASFGATIAIIYLRNTNISIGLSAFIFSLLATIIIYYLAQDRGRISVTNLLLAGIVLSSLLNSFVSLLMILNQSELVNIISFTMGSFNGVGWNELRLVAPSLLLGFVILIYFHQELNILAFGDDTANTIGVEVERVKKIILITTSLLTATTVSFTGIIGFVGLIVPHFFRLLIGSNHKYLLPTSFFGGALFMLVCDNIARSAIENSEIPVGIITAILGAPMFLYLLKKTKRLD